MSEKLSLHFENEGRIIAYSKVQELLAHLFNYDSFSKLFDSEVFKKDKFVNLKYIIFYDVFMTDYFEKLDKKTHAKFTYNKFIQSAKRFFLEIDGLEFLELSDLKHKVENKVQKDLSTLINEKNFNGCVNKILEMNQNSQLHFVSNNIEYPIPYSRDINGFVEVKNKNKNKETIFKVNITIPLVIVETGYGEIEIKNVEGFEKKFLI